MTDGVRTCAHCGAQADPGQQFCTACGRPLAAGEPAPAGEFVATAVQRPTKIVLLVSVLVVLVAGGIAAVLLLGGSDDERSRGGGDGGSTATARGQIAYQSRQGDNVDIYLINADGTGALRLTDDPQSDTQAAWSPDGGRIAFTRHDREFKSSDLWVMDADGANQRPLTSTGTDLEFGSAWSPDGSRILSTSIATIEGKSKLFVMNADGSNRLQLTTTDESEYSPWWSPDGTKIVFVRQQGSSGRIWVRNANGSDPRPLTDGAQDDGDPAWSPDGSKIVFVRGGFEHSELYVMNADGSNQRRISSSPGGVLTVLVAWRRVHRLRAQNPGRGGDLRHLRGQARRHR